MADSTTKVRMNCFDETWLGINTPVERIQFHIILYADGEIDPARLNKALVSGIKRHPALRTTLRRGLLYQIRELREDLGHDIVHFRDLTDPQEIAARGQKDEEAYYDQAIRDWVNIPFNLAKDLPFRVMVLKRRPADYSLVFSFHHYVSDALQAFRFMLEVFKEYNGEDLGADPMPEDTIECHKPNEILELMRSPRMKIRHFYPKILSSLFHRFVIGLFQPPTRIYHDRSDRLTGEAAFLHRTIPTAELNELEARVRTLSVTVNDLLLAALYKTIEKWNHLHGKKSRKISIMVPVDLGRKSSRHIVSNQLSYVSPKTWPEDRADPQKLLKKVSLDTARVIRNGNAFSQVYFTYTLTVLTSTMVKIVGTIFIKTRVYVDTTLMTNVGRIRLRDSLKDGLPRLGEARLVDISGLTPVTSPWGLSMVSGIYDAHLNMVLTYWPAMFSEKKANEFFDLFMNEVRQYPLGAPSI